MPIEAEPRDVQVWGYYGAGNFGDDLLSHYVLSTVCAATSPDRVLVSAPPGSYLELWFPGITCVAALDLARQRPPTPTKVIFGGGGQFFAFPPADLRHGLGLLRFSSLYAWRLIPRTARGAVRCYAFCVGVGPLTGAGAHWFGRRLLGACEHVSVRDEQSAQLVSTLGLPRPRLAADPSIALDCVAPIPEPSTAVGIVVRDWAYSDIASRLVNVLQAAACHLRNHGHQVQFISFNSAHDAAVLDQLTGLGEQVRQWQPAHDTIASFCRFLAGFGALVTMRAHGVYLASLLGTVPITVELEQKLQVTARRCELDDYLIAADCETPAVIAAVERALAHPPARRNWLPEQTALAQETAYLATWLRS